MNELNIQILSSYRDLLDRKIEYILRMDVKLKGQKKAKC